jgi:hypothetical protein
MIGTVLRMETVGGAYLPIAGWRHNTIRKSTWKYKQLEPGNQVKWFTRIQG